MKSTHRETAKLSLTGVTAVLITGLIVSQLPETSLGKTIKFALPLLVGIIFGAKIYFKELSKLRQKIDKQE